MSQRCFTLLTSVLLLSACDGFLTGPDDSVEVIGEVTATRDVPTALYLGTQHRLTLRVPDDTDPAEVFVAQGAGSGADVAIERRSDTQIDILPGRTGDLILELTDPDGEIQGTSRFEVRRVPDPVVELNGSLGGSINFQEFRDEVGLTPTLGDFPFEAKCDVWSPVRGTPRAERSTRWHSSSSEVLH